MNSFTQFQQMSSVRRVNMRRGNKPSIRCVRMAPSASAKSTTPLTDRVGFAERLNGRLAMLGFVSGTGNELISHMSYTDQLITHWPFVVALSGVVGFATLKTRGVELVDEQKPFTTDIEVLNGRLAMMGILMKLLYENLQ